MVCICTTISSFTLVNRLANHILSTFLLVDKSVSWLSLLTNLIHWMSQLRKLGIIKSSYLISLQLFSRKYCLKRTTNKSVDCQSFLMLGIREIFKNSTWLFGLAIRLMSNILIKAYFWMLTQQQNSSKEKLFGMK